MAEPLVEFRKVVKVFRRRNRSASLRDAIPRMAARLVGRPAPAPEPFVALDGVSFSLAPGEVLGIVGPNGAGKSTSLRLAAGIYDSDGGTVSVRGRVAALIELSAGFHPDLSGRENVFLAGALVGLRKREIEAVFDRIVDFAGIGEFLDSPVHTYSSGMAMRLGFSVAAHVPAEILLVDEVLAVGDIDFQVKCVRRMSERRREGAGVLFVSHHMPTVEHFCDRVLLVDRGKILSEGRPREVLAAYRRFALGQARAEEERAQADPRGRRGGGTFSLENVRIEGDGGLEPGTVRAGGELRITAGWSAPGPVPRPLFGVSIHTTEGHPCAEMSSAAAEGAPAEFSGKGTIEVRCAEVPLLPGDYEVTIFARDQAGFATLDLHQKLYPLRVVGLDRPGESGIVSLRPTWAFRSTDS
jgi:homopolymeric O-antigen transport system ATP-binding protein